jgi:hypothetical protein
MQELALLAESDRKIALDRYRLRGAAAMLTVLRTALKTLRDVLVMEGAAPRMNGDLRICPDSGYVVAVLANLDPPTATQISTFILDRLFRRRIDP